MQTNPREAYQKFFNSASTEMKRQHLIADEDIAIRENIRIKEEKIKIVQKTKKLIKIT